MLKPYAAVVPARSEVRSSRAGSPVNPAPIRFADGTGQARPTAYPAQNLIWARGVARLTRPPVTGKIAGSNPVAPANGYSFHSERHGSFSAENDLYLAAFAASITPFGMKTSAYWT